MTTRRRAPKPAPALRAKAAEKPRTTQAVKRDRQRDRQRAEQEAAIRERRARVMRLKRAGASYHAIAGELGISAQTAYSDVQATLIELREQAFESAGDVRTLELERLDGWQVKLEDALSKPGADVARLVGSLVRISERRARMLGLDADDEIRRQQALRQLVDMGEARRIVGELLTALRAEVPEDVLRRVQERVRTSLYGQRVIEAGGQNG